MVGLGKCEWKNERTSPRTHPLAHIPLHIDMHMHMHIHIHIPLLEGGEEKYTRAASAGEEIERQMTLAA